MDRGAEVRRWRTALHLIHCVPYNNMKGGAGFFLFCRTRRWTGRATVQSTNARWRLTRSFPSGAKSRERRTRRTSTAACIGCHLPCPPKSPITALRERCRNETGHSGPLGQPLVQAWRLSMSSPGTV